MVWLVNYLRQVFCKHEFKYEEKTYIVRPIYLLNGMVGEKHTNTQVYQICMKCGYHKSYWKYNS